MPVESNRPDGFVTSENSPRKNPRWKIFSFVVCGAIAVLFFLIVAGLIPLNAVRDTLNKTPENSSIDNIDDPNCCIPEDGFVIAFGDKEPYSIEDPRTVHLLAAVVDRSATTSYAELAVRVPEEHNIGEIETPKKYSVFSFKRWRDPDEKTAFFQYFSPREISKSDLLKLAEKNGKKTALVFVHGYNNSMKDAAFRLAQIVFDTQYNGQPLLFRWASANTALGYKRDRDSVAIARKPFIEFLKLLQTEMDFGEIHVLAHSMGNWLVMDALANFSKPLLQRPISELIMAHPDVDQDLYKVLVRDIAEFTKGMTLYASSRDFPLWFSGLSGGNFAAGASNSQGPVTSEGVDSIDISVLSGDESLMKHGTFAEHRSMVDDIGRLLMQRARPPNHRSPQVRPVPEGATNPIYWKFVN